MHHPNQVKRQMTPVDASRLATACTRAIDRIERERATALTAGSRALALDTRLRMFDRQRARIEHLRDRAVYTGRPTITLSDDELARVHRDFPLSVV